MIALRLPALVALLAALSATPAAAFDGIRITLLGTGGPWPSVERFGPSTLVETGEQVLLFDCGRGVTQRLAQAGVALKDIDAVFLTHLHSDHTVGFPDLWLTGWLRGRSAPLLVIGPDGTQDMMTHLEQAFRADIGARGGLARDGVTIAARDIGENVVYSTDDVTVTAFVVDHGAIAPAYGYRIDYQGRRSVVLSGDTRYSDNLARVARGVQLLVHEVAAADPELAATSDRVRGILAIHSTPEDAARVFRQARPYLVIYSHILLFDTSEDDVLRRTHAQYPGAVQIGRDLMVIEIQNEVQVRAAPSEERRLRD